MSIATDPITIHRVAVYAAPVAGTTWWARGSQWLGRCAWRRCALPQPVPPSISATTFATLTANPRRYGWHATLRAPWRLASGVTLGDLRQAMTALGGGHEAIELPDLRVTRLGGFLALCPVETPAALASLADDCVRRLQSLAAPLCEDERARRRPLTAEEDALMQAWGYPWVLHRFRFHFSLTGPLDDLTDAQVAIIRRAAEAHFAGLPALRLERLSLFIEPSPGADFVLLDQQEMRS